MCAAPIPIKLCSTVEFCYYLFNSNKHYKYSNDNKNLLSHPIVHNIIYDTKVRMKWTYNNIVMAVMYTHIIQFTNHIRMQFVCLCYVYEHGKWEKPVAFFFFRIFWKYFLIKINIIFHIWKKIWKKPAFVPMLCV